jgi:hypothetical protein
VECYRFDRPCRKIWEGGVQGNRVKKSSTNR